MALHYKKDEELEKMISNLEIKTDEQFADQPLVLAGFKGYVIGKSEFEKLWATDNN